MKISTQLLTASGFSDLDDLYDCWCVISLASYSTELSPEAVVALNNCKDLSQTLIKSMYTVPLPVIHQIWVQHWSMINRNQIIFSILPAMLIFWNQYFWIFFFALFCFVCFGGGSKLQKRHLIVIIATMPLCLSGCRS